MQKEKNHTTLIHCINQKGFCQNMNMSQSCFCVELQLLVARSQEHWSWQQMHSSSGLLLVPFGLHIDLFLSFYTIQMVFFLFFFLSFPQNLSWAETNETWTFIVPSSCILKGQHWDFCVALRQAYVCLRRERMGENNGTGWTFRHI